MGIELSEKHW